MPRPGGADAADKGCGSREVRDSVEEVGIHRWVALLVKQGHPECQNRHSKATAPFHLKSSLLQVKQAQHQAGRLPWVTVLGEGATGRKPPGVSLGEALGFRWQCDPNGHCRHAAWLASVEGPCPSHAP